MADTELQLLPLGTSDFSVLRNDEQIHVDKTALIYELTSKRKKFLLLRPRGSVVRQITLNFHIRIAF